MKHLTKKSLKDTKNETEEKSKTMKIKLQMKKQ